MTTPVLDAATSRRPVPTTAATASTPSTAAIPIPATASAHTERAPTASSGRTGLSDQRRRPRGTNIAHSQDPTTRVPAVRPAARQQTVDQGSTAHQRPTTAATRQ